MSFQSELRPHARLVRIPADGQLIEGDLVVPDRPLGIVVFAHGSGSSRFSARNRAVAEALNAGRFATLLIDLLSAQEERVDAVTRHLRFDIGLLASRLSAATDWVAGDPEVARLPIGYFGASTGAAAALVAAADRPHAVRAVVSRGGRPDLAGAALAHVRAATLLIVGSLDAAVIELNELALRQLRCTRELQIVPGAGHLFEERGTLERVAVLARDWFSKHLDGSLQMEHTTNPW